ncbi:MAG: hypothetical protein A3G71_04260 [Gammaproteobacteria bacterium RIFCSPLOWO2_12_FULL_38_14]|nr:MAG: hypothetical protein A3G71_04260 [Gammaproteobacteria bacterium RIFCSPLOWO2_12_FULL_38_14]
MPISPDVFFRRTSAVLRTLNTSEGSPSAISQLPASSSSQFPEVSDTPSEQSPLEVPVSSPATPIEKIQAFLKDFSEKLRFKPLNDDECYYLCSDRRDLSSRSVLQRLRTDLKKGPVVGLVDQIDSALASLLLASQLTKEEQDNASRIADQLASVNDELSKLKNFQDAHERDFFEKKKSLLDPGKVADFNQAVTDLIGEKSQPQTAISSSQAQAEETQVLKQNENKLVFNKARKEIDDLMKKVDSDSQFGNTLTTILTYLKTREDLFSRRVLLCHLSGLSDPRCAGYYIEGVADPLEERGAIYPYYLQTLDGFLADFLEGISKKLDQLSTEKVIDITALVRDFEIDTTVLNDLLSKRYYMARIGMTGVGFLFFGTVVLGLSGLVLGGTALITAIAAAALGMISSAVGILVILSIVAGACLLAALLPGLSALLMERESQRNHEKNFFSMEVKIEDLNTLVEGLGESPLVLSNENAASVDQAQTAPSKPEIKIDRRYIPKFQGRDDETLEARISKQRESVIAKFGDDRNTLFSSHRYLVRELCQGAMSPSAQGLQP